MTRIAIVEDEAAVREQLAGYVQRYTRQYGTPFEVTEFADGMEILEDYRPQFDIIFLDVEMKHLDGMETARRIRERDGGVLIVFITNMAQYAIRGYAVGALDYVLKPVPYFAFSQQLQKALGQLEKRERHYLAVAVDGGMRRLDAAEIYYLESEGHKVHFYTEKEDFVVPGTLKNYEEKLVGRAFARCNSGYLVNLAQVSGVQQDMVQVGPYTLQISRPRRKAFMAGLADYIGGGGTVTTLPDIPRLYTALAEVLAALLYAHRLPPRMDQRVIWGVEAGWAVLLGAFLQATGKVPLAWWIPCMAMAILSMLLFLWVTRSITLLEAGYVCARAFILAELAASVEWQLHCVLWPQRGGAEPLSLLLLAVVYGGIFTAMLFVENRRPGPAGKLKITPAGTFVAVVMALTAFAVSNLSFANGSEANMNMFYIRTLVDLAGALILTVQHEQLREAALHSELAELDGVLHRQYEQYKQSKENIRLINRRYHELKMQIAAIRAERDHAKQDVALAAMESGIRQYEAENKTGNPVLDTLLTAKSLYCQQHHITMTCVADGHLLDFLETGEICTIVGTALDNATESVETEPDHEKRLIRVAVYAQNGFVMLRFENYCAQEVELGADGLPRRNTHGGSDLRSVRAAAEKRGGTMTLHWENGWFTLRVLLPQKK